MDVVITTNGPGEVSTWVRPVAEVLRKEMPDCSIWVFLTPCMFAGGREKEVLQSFKEIDRVFGPGDFIWLGVFGKRPEGLTCGRNGIVLCLGGDLIHARRLGKLLGYRTYAYCERPAGRPKNDFCYFVPTCRAAERFAAKGVTRQRLRIIGNLAAGSVRREKSGAAVRRDLGIPQDAFVLNIFPGSRIRLIERSVPFFIDVVKNLGRGVTTIFTLAPYLNLGDLGPALHGYCRDGWRMRPVNDEASEVKIGEMSFFVYHGNQYDSMGAADLAVALPGSSNIELQASGIPALVVLPLNEPDRIPLPGVAEYISRLPLIGKFLKKRVFISRLTGKFTFVSPVNRDAGEEVYPEMVGILRPEEVAAKLSYLMEGNLEEIGIRLKGLGNNSGAAENMVRRILEDMKGQS